MQGKRKSRQKAHPQKALLFLSQPGAQLVTLEKEGGALIIQRQRYIHINQATLDQLRDRQWIIEHPIATLTGSLSPAGRQFVQQLEALQRGYTQLHLPEIVQ